MACQKAKRHFLAAAVCLLMLDVSGLAEQNQITLPVSKDSVRFAVIGDNGTGEAPEFAIGKQLEKYRQAVGFDFVVMLGDNIYGGHRPVDFQRKFEQPFEPLLDAGVKF